MRGNHAFMQVTDLVQILAVIFEFAVVVIALLIATMYGKVYSWFITLTFGLFVLFDITRIFSLPVSADLHALIFLVACASMLVAAGLMYRELSGRQI